MNRDKFFIYAGSEKTGSTWLYQTLQKHPEVQMPPVKELRYFSKNIENKGLLTNLFNKRKTFQLTRKRSKRFLKETIKQIVKFDFVGWKNLYWLCLYFCMPHNKYWYKKLFPKTKLSGDISPQYNNLSKVYVKKIKNINSKTKIIIGLRNPIHRVWSFAKMKYLKRERKESMQKVDKSEIHFFLKKASISNDYTTLIKKWGGYFAENQILVYCYDELIENPQKLFNKICVFLEIEPIEIDGINKKVNKGIVEEIPVEYEQELIQLNYKYIEDFAKEYPNKYSLAWLENARKYKNYPMLS